MKEVKTPEQKREAWDFAIGMAQVDGGKPSEELLNMVEQEINGEITMSQLKAALDSKYNKLSKAGQEA